MRCRLWVYGSGIVETRNSLSIPFDIPAISAAAVLVYPSGLVFVVSDSGLRASGLGFCVCGVADWASVFTF